MDADTSSPAVRWLTRLKRLWRARDASALLALALLVAMTGSAGAPNVEAAGQTLPQPPGGPVRLADHVLPLLAQATRQARQPQAAQEPVSLTIVLKLSDQAGFDALLKDIETPQSPGFRHFVSQAELAQRFGPSQQAYAAVLGYLQQAGFTLVQGSANRRTLLLRGTRAQAEQAFSVSIDDYLLGNHAFHANSQAPAVPAALAPDIQAVIGLDDFSRLAPAGPPTTCSLATLTCARTSTAIAEAYDVAGLGLSASGAGQKIGLLEMDNFLMSDLRQTLAVEGLPASLADQVSTVDVNGGTPTGVATTEVLLDIAAVMGIAPGARYVVYDAPNPTSFQALFNAMLDDGDTVISASWYDCETGYLPSALAATEGLAQWAAASGVSIFAATGDTGSTCVGGSGDAHPNVASFPAVVPHITAVGGTNLQVVGSGRVIPANNTYLSECWWGPGCAGSIASAGSYGASYAFFRPSWQTGFTTSGTRSIPDVSAESTPGIVIWQGTGPLGVTGTSLAAPIWAASVALLNQTLGTPLGNLNPALYAVGRTSAFHAPSSMLPPNNDFAHLGLGAPDLGALAAWLAGPPRVSTLDPNFGPQSGGTSVTITGEDLLGTTAVTFGDTPATSFRIDSRSQITAVSPAGSGLVDVHVTTPVATSSTHSHDLFRYAGPYVTGIEPASGTIGTPVTIHGGGFSSAPGATSISFGSVPATHVACYPGPDCVADAPPGAGQVDVRVTVGGITSPVVPKDQFTYDGPTITSISPRSGPEMGGTYVNLYGMGLANTMTVSFVAVADPPTATVSDYVVCVSSTWCTTRSPGGVGSAHIVVTLDGVSSETTTADEFTYQPNPVVLGVSPTNGPGTGGTRVTISGKNFSTTLGATSVTFGSTPATSVTCTSATQCTATSPAGTDAVHVGVTVGGLASSASDADRFTYRPVVTGITPASGPATGGTRVTVSGGGFLTSSVAAGAAPVVSFGGVAGFAVDCTSASTCVATSPMGHGTVDVQVAVGGMRSEPGPADRFTYTESSTRGWTELFPTTSPGALLGATQTYDAAHRQIVFLGAPDLSSTLETWIWDGSPTWAKQSPATSPYARTGASFAYDAASGQAVLFGGVVHYGTHAFVVNETWVWDGRTWTHLSPAASPPARRDASLAYDAAHGRLVLFGGCTGATLCTSALDDTWLWDGTSWAPAATPVAPGARAAASLAYDTATRTVVLFGGCCLPGSTRFGDTWVWDGSAWHAQSPAASPPARASAGLADDPGSGGLILFGGTTPGGLLGDTWLWNGTTWAELEPTPTPPAGGTQMVSATALAEIVQLPGSDGTVWVWRGPSP